MLQETPGLIAFTILIYPLGFCFVALVTGLALKKHIIIWFENVLYFDDEGEHLYDTNTPSNNQ